MAPKAEEAVAPAKEEKKSKKLTKEELEKKKLEEELSDEDKQLKEDLDMSVTRLSTLYGLFLCSHFLYSS